MECGRDRGKVDARDTDTREVETKNSGETNKERNTVTMQLTGDTVENLWDK